MRTLLIFITGAVLGFILAEVVGIFSYLLYDQTIGLKFFPFLLGAVLVGLDWLLQRKTKTTIYKSSLR